MPEKTVVKKTRAKKEKTITYDKEGLSDYLISTVKEVIEVARKPVPVLDKTGTPTGAVEYQSATVLKACELMAKLMGSIKDTEGNGINVQIVSYKDMPENQEG